MVDKPYLQWPKHFLYLSADKINAVYEQIDHGTVRVLSKKLTLDLKVLKAEIDTEVRRDTVYSRLKVVLAYLERRTLIGSTDLPAAYFADSLTVRWGPYGSAVTNVVYFSGETAETTLGLGGSVKNMIGTVGDSATDSSSATVSLLNALLPEEHPDDPEEDYRQPGDDWELRAVELATSQHRGPRQHVEFVAKRLIWGGRSGLFPETRSKVILGTPLYVALCD